MTKEVMFQRSFIRENFIALLTGQRPLVRLCVALQFTFQVKRRITFFTGQQLCCLGLDLFFLDSFLFSVVEGQN